MLLIDKYKPRRLTDIKGNPEKIREIINTLNKKSRILIYGPSGTGKTSLAHAIAKENNLELIEMNASDFRTKDKIENTILAAAKQQSLFGKNKLILIDEVDGISGTKDRGAIPTIVKVLEQSLYPVIITSDNPFDSKFTPIRKKTKLIELKPLSPLEISNLLKEICIKENIQFNPSAIRQISTLSSGNARAAINDLHAMILEGKLNEPIEELERDTTQSIFNTLTVIFKGNDINSSIQSYNQTTGINYDDLFLWIEENIPNEYSGQCLKNAYNILSRADVFRGRIRRQQYWRFLVYVSTLLSSGITSAKTKKQTLNNQYKKPQRILKRWIFNNRYAKKKSITEKIAPLTHTSKNKFAKEYYPFAKYLLKQNNKIIEEAELDEGEIGFILR